MDKKEMMEKIIDANRKCIYKITLELEDSKDNQKIWKGTKGKLSAVEPYNEGREEAYRDALDIIEKTIGKAIAQIKNDYYDVPNRR